MYRLFLRLRRLARRASKEARLADPYELDIPLVAGNVKQTLANLIAVRAEISANVKPSYRVHGHDFSWVEMYKYIGDEIDKCIRQINQLQPWEVISVGR